MNYYLPESVEIAGLQYPIMWDYRPILDIMEILSAPEFDEQDKIFTAMYVFYPSFEEIRAESYQEAVERLYWFINGGVDEKPSGQPKLVDWSQDFPLIVGPVNRFLGQEIRTGTLETNPLHWFTFLSAYKEIGDCTFAQVVRIRDLKSRGKKMEKQDREWYNRNRDLVDFKRKYTDADNEIFKEWGGG